MKYLSPFLLLLFFVFQTNPTQAAPSLTIYNQNFAVVCDSVPLDLKQGVNDVRFDGATLQLEPDSVILRDPSGTPIQILEQNYRNDPISQGLLLSIFEGKEIDFLVRNPNKPDVISKGKIIRSGYTPSIQPTMQRRQVNFPVGSSEPIILFDGQIRFGLPGQPLFPSLGDDAILKPQLNWKIKSDKELQTDAELSYITGGMSWLASYNVIAPEKGDDLDLVGWVTIDNQSGRDFPDAKIKLMAGDVNKIDPSHRMDMEAVGGRLAARAMATPPAVTEKAFDEYHLYTLENPSTLRDRETKQVEFVRAAGIKSKLLYVYDGIDLDWNQWRGYNPASRRTNEEFGTDSNTKVAILREFENTKENGLGIPLPKGNIRFYRSNGEQIEFVGENLIDHTPKNEKIRIHTGDAFDLVGKRTRTDFQLNTSEKWAKESWEITLTNRKEEAVTILVVEHLFRWHTWEITEKSLPFLKLSSDEIEFRVELKPDEKRSITYTVLYSW